MITYQNKDYILIENEGEPIHQMAGVYIDITTINDKKYMLMDGKYACEL